MSDTLVTVAFDVDGTLIQIEGTFYPDSPRYDVIDMFRMYERIHCDMYIWSGGGIEYATRWAERLGLIATIIQKGSIVVDIAIDDEFVKLGKVNIKV